MQAYMLSKLNERGDEIWLGTFESEELLLGAIPEKPVVTLTVVGDKVVPVVTFTEVVFSQYRVKVFEMNTIREDAGEADLPDICVTVPSESDVNTTYGVAIRDGEIVGCTCPAFQYSKDGSACKHMRDVRWNPSHYGIYSAANGYQVNQDLVLRSGASLPGSYYARYPASALTIR